MSNVESAGATGGVAVPHTWWASPLPTEQRHGLPAELFSTDQMGFLMFKKALAALSIAVAALAVAPAAANASGYVPGGSTTVSGSTAPGGTSTVGFAAGSFVADESISVSVIGVTYVTVATVKAAVLTTVTKQASSAGALMVDVVLPANASGTYTVTATGMASGNVGTASLTVAPASSTSANTASVPVLANTGSSLPFLMIWIGAGALVLGVAIVLFVRRGRRTA